MSKKQKRHQPAQSDQAVQPPHFFWRVLTEVRRNLWKGIKSLATAKGLLATVPLLISLGAYIKASIVTSHLSFILAEPLILEHRMTSLDGKRWNLGSARIGPAEAFFSISGVHSAFISNVRIGLGPERPNGVYDENCTYTIPDGPKRWHLIPPYAVDATVRSTEYSYQLRSGFVVNSNSALPIDVALRQESDADVDKAISTAINATKFESLALDQNFMDVIAQRVSKELVVCISALVSVPGTPRTRVWKVLSSSNGTLSVRRYERSLPPPPVAPGGKNPGSLKVHQVILTASEWERGLPLFDAWSFDFF